MNVDVERLRADVDALPWIDVTMEDGETGGQMVAKHAVLDLIDAALAANPAPADMYPNGIHVHFGKWCQPCLDEGARPYRYKPRSTGLAESREGEEPTWFRTAEGWGEY